MENNEVFKVTSITKSETIYMDIDYDVKEIKIEGIKNDKSPESVLINKISKVLSEYKKENNCCISYNSVITLRGFEYTLGQILSGDFKV